MENGLAEGADPPEVLLPEERGVVCEPALLVGVDDVDVVVDVVAEEAGDLVDLNLKRRFDLKSIYIYKVAAL